MKKLLVTVIGAAVAFGATAAIGPGEDFEAKTAGDITVELLGSYWSEPNDDTKTNQYAIVDSTGEAYAGGTYPFEGTTTNALQVKTTFGKPLTFNVNSTKTGEPMGSEFYFDSAVKFTVCEDAPDTTYTDAKIVMWLQETEDGSATNLFVRAGYLSVAGNTVTATPSNYVCTTTIAGDFADKYHRVTIKALPDITKGEGVPGFAIWIDGSAQNPQMATSSAEKWDSSFTYPLTEAASHLDVEEYGALFPSLVQGNNEVTAKTTITGASFDGTGWIEELKFAATAPFDDAEDFIADKGSYTISGQTKQFKTVAQLLAAIAADGADEDVTVSLSKGFELDAPIQFVANGDGSIELDFNGHVITNAGAYCAITNASANLTLKDTIGTGGIRSTGGAIYNGVGSYLTIEGGNFWGDLEFAAQYDELGTLITGGSFCQDDTEIGQFLDAGLVLTLNLETDMYDVEDATYTIKFVYGEGLATTTTVDNVAYNATPTAPTSQDVAVTGKTFTGWNPEVAAATSNATYVAQYTVNTYTITFYDEDGKTVLQSGSQSHGAALSKPADPTKTGYSFAGWTPALVDPVVGAATYTATYTIDTFTVTVTNGFNMTVAVSTNGVAAGGAAGYTVNYGDSAKVIFTANSGYNIGGAGAYTNEYASIAADIAVAAPVASENEPEGPVVPAGGKTEPYETKAAAEAKAAEINASAEAKAAAIALPTGVSDATAYYSYVQAEVAADNSVAVGFSTAGTAAAQTSANADVASEAFNTAVTAAAAAGSGTTEATVGAVPGFYYSVESGTALNSLTEGARVLATGNTVNLSVPNKGAQGFYRVKVSARAAD